MKIPPEPGPLARSARTDLAMEERELWHCEAGQAAQIPGVRATETSRHGVRSTLVQILDEQGSRELHKPQGSYLTLELEELLRHEPRAFERVSRELAADLTAMLRLQEQTSVLVVGLGNEDVTPDALGPLVLRRLFVTRHLQRSRELPRLRPVSALQPGVLGTTGMESFEVVQSVIERTRPDVLIAVDALAGRSLDRLCATVQLTDAGIVPGSGVGNHRLALTRERLGLPVYAIGAPTVVDASAITGAAPVSGVADMIVTPRSIDAKVRRIAGVIGTALNLSLHNRLSTEQLSQFVEDG